MATFIKVSLSQSIGGRPIVVSDTSNPGTVIHTSDVSDLVMDEVWLWATNTSTAGVSLVVLEDGIVASDILTLPPKAGLYAVLPGLPIWGDGTDGVPVTVYASVANVVNIVGYVNRAL